MIEALISSKTRIKLLIKFFLNRENTSYLRGLAQEFGNSSNAIRIELNRMEKAGLLTSFQKGNKRLFQANQNHPLSGEIHRIILKHVGITRIMDDVIAKLGDVRKVYLVGSFAKGLDSNIIDLIIVGNINISYLHSMMEKAEHIIHRKIRYLLYKPKEFTNECVSEFRDEPLMLYSNDTGS
jgi:predicted nucleotidyltransferase